MPIDLIAIAFDQILELAKVKSKRSEKILKALNAIGLKQDVPLDKGFDGVYAYTLVIYGIDKPKPILEFFRHEFIKSAFRKSFEQRDISILEKETENFLDWKDIGKEILAIDYDPKQEFVDFSKQFILAAKFTRTVQEVLVDHKLDDISSRLYELPSKGDLDNKLEPLYKQLTHSTSTKVETVSRRELDDNYFLNGEDQYLRTLIKDLQSRKGIVEFVELDTDTIINPHKFTENDGWEPEFVLLSDESKSPAQNEEIKGKSVREVFDILHRFVLLGKPGGGKSTTLRKIALSLALSRLEKRQNTPIPLLLSLSSWQNNLSFEQFINNRFPLSVGQQFLIEHGRVALFLDGLNEMGSAKEDKAAQIKEYIEKTAKYVVVTCRKDDYTKALDLGLNSVQITDLDDEKIEEFSLKYIGKVKAKKFLSLIFSNSWWERENNRDLSYLTRTPYLMAALAYLYLNSENSELPKNMGGLLKRITRVLWEREKSKKVSGWADYEEVVPNLSKLAYEMLRQKQPNEITMDFLSRYINNTDLLQIACNANILERRGDLVAFYHQLIQEYFAAEYINKQGITNEIHAPKSDSYRGARSATTWDQVLVALAGIHQDPNSVVSEIEQKDIFLAGECLASGVKVNSIILNRIVGKLKEASKDRQRFPATAAIETLGHIGTSDCIKWLMKLFKSSDNECSSNHWEFMAIAEALGNNRDPMAIPSLIRGLSYWSSWPDDDGGDDNDIGKACSRALTKFGNIVVPDLVKYIDNPPDFSTSVSLEFAVAAIGRIGGEEAKRALRKFVENGKHLRTAIEGLGETGDEADTHLILSKVESISVDAGYIADEFIVSLGKLGNKEAVPKLINLLEKLLQKPYRNKLLANEGPKNRVLVTPYYLFENRAHLTEALGKLADPSAIPVIVKHYVLTHVPHKYIPNVAPIVNVFTDWGNEERSACSSALFSLGKPDIIPNVIKVSKSANPKIRLAATILLGRFRDSRSIPVLLKHCLDKDKDVSEAAFYFLGEFNDPLVLKTLENYKLLESNKIRKLARSALLRAKKAKSTSANVKQILEEDGLFI